MRVAERVNGVWRYLIYDIGGKLVAEYGGWQSTDEGVRYVMQDWQGSTRAVVNNSGFVQARSDYTAFGEEIASGVGLRTAAQGFGTANNLRQKYGLTERDDSTGLDYAVNRTYDSKQGRFTQVDPIGMGATSLGSPQSLNLYTYCGNDPINNVDPSGLFWGKLFRGILKILTNKWVRIAVSVALAVLSFGAAGPLVILNFAAQTAAVTAAGWLTAALSGFLFASGVSGIASHFAQTHDPEKLRTDCRVQGLLGAIIVAEGGYPTRIVGGKVISAPDKSLIGQKNVFISASPYPNGHPNIKVRVREKFKFPNGKVGPLDSTAAGNFQIIKSTWDRFGGGVFTPDNQELVAIKILDSIGAIDPLLNGDLQGAVDKANGQWASLPGAKNNQPTVPWGKFVGLYEANKRNCEFGRQ